MIELQIFPRDIPKCWNWHSRIQQNYRLISGPARVTTSCERPRVQNTTQVHSYEPTDIARDRSERMRIVVGRALNWIKICWSWPPKWSQHVIFFDYLVIAKQNLPSHRKSWKVIEKNYQVIERVVLGRKFWKKILSLGHQNFLLLFKIFDHFFFDDLVPSP